MANIGKVVNGLEKLCNGKSGNVPFVCYDALELLKEQQSKNGEWVGIDAYIKHLEHKTGEKYCASHFYSGELFCNKCWKPTQSAIKSNFCPNCGADMRGERE